MYVSNNVIISQFSLQSRHIIISHSLNNVLLQFIKNKTKVFHLSTITKP